MEEKTDSVSCEECYRVFTNKTKLRRHRNSIHLGITHACSKCDYKANQKSNLQEHIVRIHEGKPYECLECDFKTKSRILIRNHRQAEHGVNGKSAMSLHHKNKQTTKNQKYRKSLKRAIKVSNIKIKKEAVEREESKENSAKPKCSECDYEFASEARLQIHMTSKHSEHSVKHSCDKCNKSFATRASYRRHLKETCVGLGENRPSYPCPKCDASFTIKTNLKRHINGVHLGVTYNCEYENCDYKASQQSNLQTHIEVVHEKKRLQCKLCPFQTVRKIRFSEHMVEKHQGSKERPVLVSRPKATPKVSVPKPSSPSPQQQQQPAREIKLVEFYCDLCMFEAEEEKSLTNHLALEHYEDVFGV